MTFLSMRASIVSTLFLLIFSISSAQAQDFFEELFGGADNHHSAPIRSRSPGVYRDSHWSAYRTGGGRRQRETRETRRVEGEARGNNAHSGSGGSSGSSNWSGDPKGSEPGAGASGEFCVRACDGYVFPLIRSAQATKQESCAFACPSASVEYFHGGSIDSARNLRGQRYSELPNAFKYREQTTPGCACHPPEASQQTSLRIARKDPTAQAGDIVVENGGAFVFNGKRVVPIEGSHQVSASIRRDVKRMTEGPAKPGFAAVVASHPAASAQAEAAAAFPPAVAPIGSEAGSRRDERAKDIAPTFAVAGLEPVGAGDDLGDIGSLIIFFTVVVFAGAFAFVNRHVLAPAAARAVEQLRKTFVAFISVASGGAATDPPSAWVWSSYRGVIETPEPDMAGYAAARADGSEAPPLAWVWSAYRGELIPEETVAALPEQTTSRHEAPRKEPARLFGPRQAAAA